MAVLALQQIRKMRGGAQGHLMLGSDDETYIVKFQNNPQHVRVLANEFVATRLATAIGLTVPACDVVEVTEWLVQNTRELNIERENGRVEPCCAGLHFGSRMVGGLMPGHAVDYLPEEKLAEVRNIEEFSGMLILDKWTSNSNGRQAVFHKRAREKKYQATFIDQGYCFNGGSWTFVDAPLRGVFGKNTVYQRVTGWESFEPWLSRALALDPQVLWRIAENVPPEWYGGDISMMERLIDLLLARRGRIEELIDSFRESSRAPFPNWMRSKNDRVGRLFAEPDWHDRNADDKRIM